MIQIIKDGRATESAYSLDGGQQRILPLAEFLADKDADAVALGQEDEVEALEGSLARIQVIALAFPVFTDGRAYSSASLLRRKYGYQGELRAVGDVRVDQLEQMLRCGFDAFELAEGQDMSLALAQVQGFSHSYQQTADREPLFRNRPA